MKGYPIEAVEMAYGLVSARVLNLRDGAAVLFDQFGGSQQLAQMVIMAIVHREAKR